MPDTPLKIKESRKIGIQFFGSFASSFLSVIALIGFVMTLAGYGVAMAVETQFGIPHATIFKSGFDLLSLSVWFMTWILTNSLTDLQTILFNPSYWKSAIWLASFGMIGCLVGIISVLFGKSNVKNKCTEELKRLESINKSTKAALVTLAVGVVSAAVSLIGWPLMLWGGLTIAALIGTIPAISLEAGENHIQEYVIKPTRCMSLFNRDERLKYLEQTKAKSNVKEKVATCIKLFDDGKLIAQGRVVFSTTELIVLYDPKSGNVSRESLDKRSIHMTSEL